MADLNREKLLKGLLEFYELAKSYGKFDFSDEEQTELLREHLVRLAGGIKPLVVQLTGTGLRAYTYKGKTIDIWEVGLRKYHLESMPIYASNSLLSIIDSVNESIGILESEFSEQVIRLRTLTHSRPQIFISHGGKSQIRDKLALFLWNSGCEPTIVEDMPGSQGTPDQRVNKALGDADFAVILADKEHTSVQDGKLYPRLNVVDEIERIRRDLGERFIVLIENGVTLPSLQQTGVTYVEFASDNFDAALLRVVLTLQQFDIL